MSEHNPSAAGVADGETLIEAQGIHAFYGESHVLHGVDLAVRQGEAVSLMGRNGMGKTTTLRTLLGLVKARDGQVLVRGANMTGKPTHAIIRQGIGYVPEGRGIFPNLSVKESLIMAARPGLDGQRDWTLERVLDTFPRLTERLYHMSGNLSGGEQQMVAIGRALMTNPDLLILDEATEGLAPLIRQEIWRVVRTVRDTGMASLIVDKNVNALLELTDHGIIMVKGKVVVGGSAKDLAKRPEILREYIGV